jgi:hypothetical protein
MKQLKKSTRNCLVVKRYVPLLNSTSFAISILFGIGTSIESRVGSNSEVTLTCRNKVEKEMESFLVEGDDLRSLSIPLPYVPLLDTSASFEPFHTPVFHAFHIRSGRWTFQD